MLIISRGLRVSGLASFTLSIDSFGYLCYFSSRLLSIYHYIVSSVMFAF